jgi:hypothetical protein
MTREELFELQSELIISLTDSRAFGKPRNRLGSSGYLVGVEPAILELLAMLALGKRIDKIFKILPRTSAYLNTDLKELACAFAARHPPLSADSYFNACQFYAFLRRMWLVRTPDPPFLPDLTYCELAMIGVERKARATRIARLAAGPSGLGTFSIRRHPAVHMRQCQYNIQPLLDGSQREGLTIEQRSVCLILSRPLYAMSPKVFQVDAALFDVVRTLGGWILQALEDFVPNRQTLSFYRKLEELGFIEVRPCESE